MKILVLMIQFLTRIPININLKVDEEDFMKGIVFFPIVGLIIGMIVVSTYYIGFTLGGSFLGAIFAVVAEIFITGGLHLDGLADTFDGIYSNRPKDRILEIMKDSRLGTNGALAIFVILITKIALISQMPTPMVYPIIMIMPVFSRLNLVTACRFSEPARKYGMGNMFIGKVTMKQFVLATLTGIAIAILYPITIPGGILLIIFALWYIKHISYRIDGMSGDTLGSLCELSEVLFLFYITIIFRFLG